MLGHRRTCLRSTTLAGAAEHDHLVPRGMKHPVRPSQHHLISGSSSSSGCCSSGNKHTAAAAAAATACKRLLICRAGSASTLSPNSSSNSSTGIELRRTLLLQQLLLDEIPYIGSNNPQPSELSSVEPSQGIEDDNSTKPPERPSSAKGSSSSSSRVRGKGFSTTASSSSSSSSSSRQQQQVAADAACPCRSGLLYQHCCQPFLTAAATPRSALELVSARLTAAKTGNAAYLVSTTHPESSLALGGARDMAGRAKRKCANFKANKFEVLGMAHCPGDLPDTWVVLTILQATAGEYSGQKAPFMELIVRRNWTRSAATAAARLNNGLWSQDDAAAAAAAGDGQNWMYLKNINEFPENGQADVLIQLIQRHCPEVLMDRNEQQQQQQQGVAEREICFAWGAPNLHVGQRQQGTDTTTSSSSSSSSSSGGSSSSGSSSRDGGDDVWYVDLLKSAAEPLNRRSWQQQQQRQRAAVSEDAYQQMLSQHKMLVPPGVFIMDEYLDQKAQRARSH